MTKKKKILLGAGAACLLVCLCIVLVMCSGGRQDVAPTTTGAAVSGEPVTYTVQVKNQGGLFLPNVGVYIYEDDTLAELVWFAKTDDSGKMTFTDVPSESYVAVLTDVPTGYAVETMYPITGEQTEIVLSAAQMSEDVTDLTYKLGDMMMDFTVEDAEGNTYTLSKLLEQKKAVVLNFWYVACGPCKAEFPYLQEAYEKYSDSIAVLAMNPVDDAEAVAKFQKEMGLTFPMMACDPEWANIMQLTAYPTTVVIDRYGNITLIHKGSVDNAKTFADTFAYFAAEEYQQKLIKDIAELVTEEEEGSKEKPIELGGVMSFEVTVKPGEVVYTDLYKVSNMYLQIQSKDAYVLYNDKTYEPVNGIVGLVVNAPDTYTPAKIGIGNSGKETLTFKAYLSILKGTINNPYTMNLGEFSASVSAGNEQGVYYVYTATEDGILTVQCLEVTAGVEYGYTLYNLDSYAQRTLDSEGEVDENGIPTLSIQARKGQTVQFIASTLPDENNSYPAATFKFQAVFTAGEIKEEEKVEKIPYTVTIKDAEGNPIPNVGITLSVDDTALHASTDSAGVAVIQLVAGTYQGTFTVPEGYDPVQSNAFELTAEKTAYEVTLTKTVIVMHDYAVKVVDANGNAVTGVKVKIGSTIVTTGTDGTAVFNLEQGSYTASIQELPEGYTVSAEEYAFAEGKTELRIELAVKPGTVGNPYQVSQYPYDTASVDPGKEQHYVLSNAGGMVLNIRNSSAYVIYNETKYEPVDGQIWVPLADGQIPAGIVIGNSSEDAKRFTLNLAYPVGDKENPEVLEQLGQNMVALPAGDGEGYYYTWTAVEDGTVHFTADSITEGVAADIIVTVGDTTVKLSDTQGASEVSVWVDAGDEVSVQIVALPDTVTGQIPAAQIAVGSAFKLPPNSVQYPDVLTNISQIDVSLAEGDTDGLFYTWTPANSGVASFTISSITEGVTGDIILSVAGSETVVKLSNGMVDGEGKPVAAITVARGDVLSIQVTAEGKEAQLTVSGNLTQDPNSAENPDAIEAIDAISTSLVAGDPDGHYYVWTAAYDGTVSFRIGSVTDGVQGNLTLCVNGAEHPLTGGVASADVKAGDEVLVHVQALADGQTGEYPAAQITVNGSFVHEVGSIQNPKPVANISQLTTTLEAGDSNGYHYSWTATENCTAVFHVSDVVKTGPALLSGETDPAEWVDIVLYVNGARKASLSENENKDNEGNRIVSAAVKKGDLVTIQVVTLKDTDGEHPAATIDIKCRIEIRYSVTVTDMFGKAQSGIAVTVKDASGGKVYAAFTDENGAVTMVGEPGTYNVELAFEGTSYYYNKETAVFSTERTSVTIQLADYLDTANVYEGGLYTLNDADTYYLEQGSAYVELSANKSYYSVYDGFVGYCMFVFHPTESGTYKFSVDNPDVEIAYLGTSFSLYHVASSAGSEDNSFSFSVGSGTAGHIDMVIGIKAADGVAGTVVSISRVGPPNWSVEDEPWSEDWKKGHTHSSDCAIANSASTVTYLDINAASGTYELYYNEATGVYQLYEDGPVVLVDLNASLISFYKIIKGDGAAGGAPIRRYFYDGDGFVKKEDYTETFVEYFACAGQTSASQKCYHPLTKDLAYMIQNGGAGWWDSSSGSQIDTLVKATPEYAWMFACCYIAQ